MVFMEVTNEALNQFVQDFNRRDTVERVSHPRVDLSVHGPLYGVNTE